MIKKSPAKDAIVLIAFVFLEANYGTDWSAEIETNVNRIVELCVNPASAGLEN